MAKHWLEPVLVLAAVALNGVVPASPEVGRDYDRCSYDVKVWQPDSDMVLRMRLLETKYANVSNYVDKELLKIRFGASSDLHQYQNWTMRLERAIMEQRVKEMERQSKVKDVTEHIELFKNKLQDVGSKVDDFILNFSDRKPKALRRKQHVRKDRMISSQARAHARDHDPYIMDVLKNMVADLKAEWILMKRDLLDMRTDTFDLKKGQNQLYNSSIGVETMMDSIGERAQIIQSSDLKQTSDIENLKSNVQNLKQDLSSLKTAQERQLDAFIEAQNDVSTLRQNAVRIQQGVNILQKENIHLRNLVKSPRPTDTVIIHRALGDAKSKITTTDVTPKDCADIYAMGYQTSGVYQVKPTENLPLDNMYCELVNNTGYTVIQRRTDGLLSFSRGWLEYKIGFGNLYGDFWAGNDIIHFMTKDNKYGMRIDMWDWEGNRSFAEYSDFSIESNEDSYKLHVRGYAGNAGDSLSYHDQMKFSTVDRDNDIHERNCAADNKGGWWYNSCFFSQLNGVYHAGWYSHSMTTYPDGIVWYTLKDSERYSLRKVEMKLWRHG